MEIKLSPTCEALTGSLGRGFGYFIVRRKNGFFGVRSRHHVPHDGHWRFILACAELAKNGLHISDIEIHWVELSAALYEAEQFIAGRHVRKKALVGIKLTYNAADVINLKITFSL